MVSLRLDIPDFSVMGDDEVERHPSAMFRDGRWSRQTKSLLAHFGTDRLNLNENWASTSTTWSCPACGRSKPEIARMTPQAVLLCQLDEHHDHLRDHVETILKIDRDRVSDDQRVRITTARLAVMDMSERFCRTIICGDCNQVDGAAKLQIGETMHADFSFSPSEIATFISPVPNSRHEFDLETARRLWVELRPGFLERIAFAQMMAGRIAQGLHDREYHRVPLGLEHRRDADLIYTLICRAADGRSSATNLSGALLARSRSADGNASSLKKRPKARAVAIPTEADFEIVQQGKSHPGPWTRAGSDWVCPICARGKFAIVRKSKKGTWTAGIHEFHAYEVEADVEHRRRRSRLHHVPIVISHEAVLLICQDCKSIVTEAKKIVPGAGDAALKPDDLRRLMGQTIPHRSHILDQAAIREAAVANRDWDAGVLDYRSHQSEARLYRSRLDQLCADHPRDKDAMFHYLLMEWSEKLTEPDPDAEAHFRWILTEGQRFRE